MTEQRSDAFRPVHFRLFTALSVLSGLTALFFTFSGKSELKNAGFLGYSPARWVLGAVTMALLAGCLLVLIRELRSGGKLSAEVDRFLSGGDRAYFTFWVFLLLLYFFDVC